MSVEVRGIDQYQALARQLKAAGAKGLGREMAAGLRKAAGGIGKAVTAEAGRVMPSRGGYRGELTRSLRHRTEVRTSGTQARLRMRTFADGQAQRRDVPALNRGVLRHPVFGRSRRGRGGRRWVNPWAVTRISAGFWDRPTMQALPAAQREMARVLDEVAAKLANG